MIADVGGIWYGTLDTDGLFHAQGVPGDEGGWGGPPRSDRISLWISSQGDYKDFGYGQVVSPISGQVDGLDFYAVPVSGFVDDVGRVKLLFYERSTVEDWTFNGRLTVGATRGDISGNWTRMSWSNGLFLYQLGTMSVQKRGFIVTDRAYIGALGRDF